MLAQSILQRRLTGASERGRALPCPALEASRFDPLTATIAVALIPRIFLLFLFYSFL